MKRYRVFGIELPLGKPGDEALKTALARELGVRIEAIGGLTVVRRSLDARKGRRAPTWVHTLDVELEARPSRQPPGIRVSPAPEPHPRAARPGKDLKDVDAIVVGTGPAGLFAAQALLERGAHVRVLEQGPPLQDRTAAVAGLWRSGVLHPDANVQFGEGGAGTFSDGKLMTRVRDPLVREVMERFVEAGAPDHILEDAHPHLGTDGVRDVVAAMRRRMEGQGATFHFREQILDVQRAGDGYGLVTGAGRHESRHVFLAVGHSSRALFRRLSALGVAFTAKGFAVGVRVEHPQRWVDECQYGRYAGHPELPASEYFLTHKDPESGRGVYSFCMCPGGLVVNSASEPDGLVTNGMSLSQRASGSANAGIVVSLTPADFDGEPFRGVELQEGWERKAYALGGGGYVAPAQSIRAFLEDRAEASLPRTTFRPGVRPVNLRGFFPPWIEGPLVRGFQEFDRKMRGFIDKGVLIAPETRTSSPLQLRRAEDRSAEGFPGLYMLGEGAGWAGGIVSSAVDALRCVAAFRP